MSSNKRSLESDDSNIDTSSKRVKAEEESTPLPPQSLHETVSDAKTEVLERETSTLEPLKQKVESITDPVLASMDVENAIRIAELETKGKEVVVYTGGKQGPKEYAVDPTQYLLGKLGLGQLYWYHLFKQPGNLGYRSWRKKGEKNVFVSPKTSIQQMFNNRGLTGLRDCNGIWIAMPISKGMGYHKLPPYGDAGGSGEWDTKEGSFNKAHISGQISRQDGLLYDVEDRPGFSPLIEETSCEEAIKPSRMAACLEWMSRTIWTPCKSSHLEMLLNDGNTSIPDLKDIKDAIKWNDHLFKYGGLHITDIPKYTAAFADSNNKLTKEERDVLKMEIARTRSLYKEGSATKAKFNDFRIFRLISKDDEGKGVSTYDLVKMGDWRQYADNRIDGIDYDNDYFIHVVSPRKINSNPQDPTDFKFIFNLEFVIWLGKKDDLDLELMKTDVKKMIDLLFDKRRETPCPAPLTPEVAWELPTGKALAALAERQNAEYLQLLEKN